MKDDDKKGQSGQPPQGGNPPGNGSDTPQGKLDKLLAEWDQATQGTDSGKPDKGKSADGTGGDALLKRMERLEAVLSRTNYETDMKDIVSEVKGDLDVDDWIVESWINRKADSDPRLVKLWEERDEKKGQFREVIKNLAPEFQAYAKDRILPKSTDKDDKDDKADRNDDRGLSAAVRSSRTASPSSGLDDVNWSALSGPEFALKRAEVFRLAKAGKLT